MGQRSDIDLPCRHSLRQNIDPPSLCPFVPDQQAISIGVLRPDGPRGGILHGHRARHNLPVQARQSRLGILPQRAVCFSPGDRGRHGRSEHRYGSSDRHSTDPGGVEVAAQAREDGRSASDVLYRVLVSENPCGSVVASPWLIARPALWP